MRTVAWTCLWPGLPALWVRGRLSGLAMALGFAVLVDVALLATLAGDMLVLAERSRWLLAAGAWSLVVGLWTLGWRSGRKELSGMHPSGPLAEIDGSFCAAQTQYLKGHWIEAETLLAQLLARRPEDVEGRLLLATIWRRTGRAAEAKPLLSGLRSDPDAAGWWWEVERELERISEGGERIERRAA